MPPTQQVGHPADDARSARGSHGRGYRGPTARSRPLPDSDAHSRDFGACGIERLLFERFAPKLRDLVVLKTDLWDEAKNTEILRWVAEQGARPAGVDVAPDIVRAARRVVAAHRPGFVGGDVRALPFRDASVDLVYSMERSSTSRNMLQRSGRSSASSSPAAPRSSTCQTSWTRSCGRSWSTR
jgi:hypothetical protein